MDLITLLVAALATARLTRLVTSDRITQAPRQWMLRRLPSDSLTAYLIVCDWCVSVYVGLGVAAIVVWAPAWPVLWWAGCALAFSYVAGWLARGETE